LQDLHILPVREFLVYGFCKRKYENGTENRRPLHKSEPEFALVEAKVDFAGPTPPELTSDTLMAYLHKHPGP